MSLVPNIILICPFLIFIKQGSQLVHLGLLPNKPLTSPRDIPYLEPPLHTPISLTDICCCNELRYIPGNLDARFSTCTHVSSHSFVLPSLPTLHSLKISNQLSSLLTPLHFSSSSTKKKIFYQHFPPQDPSTHHI